MRDDMHGLAERAAKRRQWVAAGTAPAHWRSHYTEAQLAAINVIFDEIRRNGRCELSHAGIGHAAGVGKETIQRAVGIAVSLDHLKVTRRADNGLSNVLKLALSK